MSVARKMARKSWLIRSENQKRREQHRVPWEVAVLTYEWDRHYYNKGYGGPKSMRPQPLLQRSLAYQKL